MSIKPETKFTGDTKNLEKVFTKDFKKKQTYVLSWDYYPYGGTYVNFTRTVRANTVWPGERGEAYVVKSIYDDKEFYIQNGTYIFKEKEKINA